MEDSDFFERSADQRFGSSNQKFDTADQKFGCLNPYHLLIGLTKNEGPPNQNFGQANQIAVWLSRSPQKVGSA